MKKKRVIKDKISRKPKESNESVIKELSQNTIQLQKVMVNLADKLNNLSIKIDKMLDLFEESAKSIAEKEFSEEKDKKDYEELNKKIETIMDQNKTLAKGITLFAERGPEQMQKLNPNMPQNFQRPQINTRPPAYQPNQLQRSIMTQETNEETNEDYELETPTPELTQEEENEDINLYKKQVSTRPTR